MSTPDEELQELRAWKLRAEIELRRLRGDADGLKEDFASLQQDAAEVVRQWHHGSVGLVDEAIGKLQANGRPDWWKRSESQDTDNG
jgi:hypothetical protein